jgi:hypothetical protein
MSEEQKSEEQVEELPPFVIEGARSSRSKCKVCRKAIQKETLRLGILIEGPYGTGYIWHHLKCAAKRKFDHVKEAYAVEAWKEAKVPPTKVPKLEELERLREEADLKRKERKTIPYAELAPSGRSRCKHCNELIEKGSPRVVLGRGIIFGNQERTAPVSVHPQCVQEELMHEESITEREGLEGELRSNSGEFDSGLMAQILGQIDPAS